MEKKKKKIQFMSFDKMLILRMYVHTFNTDSVSTLPSDTSICGVLPPPPRTLLLN